MNCPPVHPGSICVLLPITKRSLRKGAKDKTQVVLTLKESPGSNCLTQPLDLISNNWKKSPVKADIPFILKTETHYCFSDLSVASRAGKKVAFAQSHITDISHSQQLCISHPNIPQISASMTVCI